MAFNLLSKGRVAVGAITVEGGVAPTASLSPATLYGVTRQSLTVSVPIITAATETSVSITAATWALSTLASTDQVDAQITGSTSALGTIVLTRAIPQSDGSLKVYFLNSGASSSTAGTLSVSFTHWDFTA